MTETQTLRLPQDSNSTSRSTQRLLRRVGTVDPTDVTAYRASGGFEALRRALEIGPDAVIREVIDSKLMGRGGAAFPTGRKWEAVREAAGASALPHLQRRRVRAGHVQGSCAARRRSVRDRRGDDDRRHSPPAASADSSTFAASIRSAPSDSQHAIDEANAHGFLGNDILGRGCRFDIEIRRGAGAYICGEETAIFNSIEGYRGEPRNKPPFPVQAGLFGLPTVVNNVETLANVPSIVLDGGAAFAAIGTEQSTGTKLFCVSGNVARPGRLRGALRHDAARSARARRRRRERAIAASRFCSAARRACSSGPTSSTCRSRSRACAPPRRRSAPA